MVEAANTEGHPVVLELSLVSVMIAASGWKMKTI
jgi:hypothetical protein